MAFVRRRKAQGIGHRITAGLGVTYRPGGFFDLPERLGCRLKVPRLQALDVVTVTASPRGQPTISRTD